jgi:predicted DNA-binding transcriptional regulator YafY
MKETLNIEYHTRRMVTFALRKYQSPTEAAKHLEISSRTIHRYIHLWNIKYKKDTKQK